MGFSGGGSNVLLPHTHDGTVSQDGGSLDFNNITQSNSASGQMFYSDGVHLQQLTIGAPNDEIRVSGANIPEWYTPAAAGSNYEFLGSSSGTNTTSISVNFAAVQPPDYVIVTYSGTVTVGQGADWRINTISSSTYDSQGSFYSGGAETLLNTTGDNKLYGALSSIAGSGFLVNMKAFINPLTENIYYQTESYSDANGYSSIAGRNTTAAQTGITDIEMFIAAPFSGTVSVWAVRN
jgi:hypothetical protein